MLPPTINDYINYDNPVRAIDAYVESLDLQALGFVTPPAKSNSGQPAYPPNALLKLYLYGYLNQVRSSRRLEREANRNLELIWLLGHLTPSYKTIANFRKNFPQALKQVNRDFILLCKSLNLFGGETVAIDGSFFHANASKASIKKEKRIIEELEYLEKRITTYHEELEHNDHHENKESLQSLHIDPDLATKLAKLKQRQIESTAQLKHLKETGEKQYSKTDADARLLNKGIGGTVAGYNIQSVVDDKHKLILCSEVTNDSTDQKQLIPMAQMAKETLAIDTLVVLADAGYYKQEHLAACEEANIIAYVPEPNKSKQVKDQGRFTRDMFRFDVEGNCYICPENQLLNQQGTQTKDGHERGCYGSRASICKSCIKKSECLPSGAAVRKIYRSVFESVVERHRERMKIAQGVMRRRSGLVEHPFGTLKRRAGWDHFLVRGFEKVRGEWSIMILCYNLTRVINIIGLQTFIEHCENRVQMSK